MDEETPVPFKQYFPKLSLAAYFWVVIFVSLVVFGILGYFVGIRVSQLPSSALLPNPTGAYSQQIQPQVITSPYDDNDTDYSNISGYFVTNTNAYDQFSISIAALPSNTIKTIDTDNRPFNNPHVGINYPYMFSRLNPLRSYEVFASSCRTNPKTYALECAKNIVITKCTGKIQGKTCVITGNGLESQSSGEVDFAIEK